MSGCCFDAIFVLLYMLLCMSHLFHNRTSCNTNKEKQPYTGKEGGIPKLSKTQAVCVHMNLAHFFIVESCYITVHYIKFKMCL